MPCFTNWRYSTVTTASTTDADQGTPILSTGAEPRAIFQMASYSGTNSAACTISYIVVPATSLPINSAGQIDITGDESFNLGFGVSDISAATETFPYVMVPFGVKGAFSAAPPIIPPNCILCAVPSINQNGTAIHTVISAEYC